MSTSTFIGLLNNAALLIALALVFDTIVLRPGFEKSIVKILSGIVFGILGVAVMLTPWEFIPGIFFDTRSIILSIGGLFFGTIPTLIAMVATGILRYVQGGVGTWTGIGVIVTSGILGIVWRQKRKKVLGRITSYEIYIFSVVVHIAMLLWMLTLPWAVAKDVISKISLTVLILYPIGGVLLGRLLITRLNRKTFEQSVVESESRYRALFENMNTGFVLFEAVQDNNGVPADLIIVAANKGFAETTGLNLQEVTGKHLTKVLPGIEKDEADWIGTYGKIALHGESKQFEQGSELLGYFYSINAYRAAPNQCAVTFLDITDLIKTKSNLEKSELRYRNLYDFAPDMFCSFETESGKIIECNQTIVKELGFSKEELTDQKIYDIITPESNEYISGYTNPESNAFGILETDELTLQRKDGSLIDVSLKAKLLVDFRPNISIAQAVFRDISQQKQLEKEKAKSDKQVILERDKFQSVLNAIGEGLYIIDSDYIIEYQNEIFTNEYGNCIGQKCHQVVFQSPNPCSFCPIFNTSELTSIKNIETYMPDGRCVNIVYSPYAGFEGDIKTIVLMLDITEKKTLQAETIRAAHLASLGELSAGIAHEINNPINGIISLAEVMKDELMDMDTSPDIPDRIINEGNRVASIISNLLTFSRDKKEEHSPALLFDILKDVIQLLENQLIKDEIKLEINIPEDLPKIKARSQEIQQVFMNLLSNSRYALNKKYKNGATDKKIIISSQVVEIDNRNFVRTALEDNGTGIPKSILHKSINPFFSTKPPGEGTGLGLSISHTIIKNHGGGIQIESEEDQFTRVIIDLPTNNGWTIQKAT